MTEKLGYALITIAMMGTILIIAITSPPIRQKFQHAPVTYQAQCSAA